MVSFVQARTGYIFNYSIDNEYSGCTTATKLIWSSELRLFNHRLAVMLYVRFPLSLRNLEDLLHERGIEISHETVRFWWNRFGPMFAGEI